MIERCVRGRGLYKTFRVYGLLHRSSVIYLTYARRKAWRVSMGISVSHRRCESLEDEIYLSQKPAKVKPSCDLLLQTDDFLEGCIEMHSGPSKSSRYSRVRSQNTT